MLHFISLYRMWVTLVLGLPVLPSGEVGNNKNCDYDDDDAAQCRSNGATCRLATYTIDHSKINTKSSEMKISFELKTKNKN